jgi:hypothetical protein
MLERKVEGTYLLELYLTGLRIRTLAVWVMLPLEVLECMYNLCI